MTKSLQFSGYASYSADATQSAHRLLVAIRCRIEGLPMEFEALLDTGSEWCVLPSSVADAIEVSSDLGAAMRLHSRLGTFQGLLARRGITFLAEAGEEFQIDATWFVSPEWNGPVVIGWKGCLERMCFAIEPATETFWFAEPQPECLG